MRELNSTETLLMLIVSGIASPDALLGFGGTLLAREMRHEPMPAEIGCGRT